MEQSKLTPKNIWNERQNLPSLIVRDLEKFISPNVIYESLLRRGVFKWLTVRRHLIKLKDTWKDRLNKATTNQKESTYHMVHYWRGYRKAIEECRKEVRLLCHSQRWEVPDIDVKAKRWLEEYEKKESA